MYGSWNNRPISACEGILCCGHDGRANRSMLNTELRFRNGLWVFPMSSVIFDCNSENDRNPHPVKTRVHITKLNVWSLVATFHARDSWIVDMNYLFQHE
jgi:hypothetical protein